MADVKISFKIGNIEFVGEGEKEFIGEQLDKIISNAPKLVKLAPEFPIVPTSDQEEVMVEMGEDPNIAAKTLPAYLKEKNATTIQVKKFLATAVWIESKGKEKPLGSVLAFHTFLNQYLGVRVCILMLCHNAYSDTHQDTHQGL